MTQQPPDLQNVRDDDFPSWLFGLADRQFHQGQDLVGAKVSEMAVAYALFETHRVPIPTLIRLDVQRHLWRGRYGRLERIEFCEADLNHGRTLKVFPSARLAGHIERHLSLYRPRLLADHSCSSLFPSPNGTSSIDFSSQDRMRIFELCWSADNLSNMLCPPPVGVPATVLSLRRRTTLLAICMTL